jgi:ribonucleoside-diphosphate reductase subunit M1
MYVTKRSGKRELVAVEKITERLMQLSAGLTVDCALIAQRVAGHLRPDVTTSELDMLAAEESVALTTTHPDYGALASKIAVSNLHKTTDDSFSKTMLDMHARGLAADGPVLSDVLITVLRQNGQAVDAMIDHRRDYDLTYFGLKTLERSYLLKTNDAVVERPQYMFMRVALGIHGTDLEAARQTYDMMSTRQFTHATPTLFNAGTVHNQLASCFLLPISKDTVAGVYDTLSNCAHISHMSGGIGLHVHNIRGGHTVATLRLFNNMVRHVGQLAAKRPSSIAVYIEPWHADIVDVIALRRNTGPEELRARDLFLALWVPDLFMRRVESDGDWTLMCPRTCPGLDGLYGAAFDEAYEQYEREGMGVKTMPARKLWAEIVTSQIETGGPFMVYKDACNAKSNQKNLGTIRSSNLCTEIIQFSSPEETAVCNLASISLPAFVSATFDHTALHDAVRVVTRNLNKVIDLSLYPTVQARKSNRRHRPIGIGVQGLADVFMMLRMPFDSPPARELNKAIFETMYHAAMTESIALAQHNGAYDTFAGSPLSEGKLQFDLWGVTPSDRWDWETLRCNLSRYGARNSLLIAPMPTASTAQVLGNNESIEPYTSNVYSRQVLSGAFQVVNKHLMGDLIARGLWTDELRHALIADRGSVQKLAIPDDLKELYRTVWEIPQKSIIDMAADRAPFVCQSQSLNIHMHAPSVSAVSSMHFYGWRRGLKTGMYYLRTRPAVEAIQFTVDKAKAQSATVAACIIGCESCSA